MHIDEIKSSMKVIKHDAGAQQTDLELTYGKLRTQAQKIAKPDGKFTFISVGNLNSVRSVAMILEMILSLQDTLSY